MATKTKHRRYWDACNFIAIINGEPGRVAICEAILREAEKPDATIEIVTSIMTIAEVVKPRGCSALSAADEAIIDKFFENDWLIPVNCDRAVMIQARTLQRQFGIKVRDSIHIASALYAQVAVIETYDLGLLGCNGMGSPPLVVRAPDSTGLTGVLFQAPPTI